MTRCGRAMILAALTAALASAPAAPASDRSMAFSGRCPIDVIFPLTVDADRAREFVPAGYAIATEGTGQAMVIVSLVACNDTVVDGVTRSDAMYSDLLFQVNPPPGGGTPFVDQKLDGYWGWVVTNERKVHAGLTRLGMFHGFDRKMSLSPTWAPGGERLLALDGTVSWPHSPFRIRGKVLDLSPLGLPPYFNHFWQDVGDGVLKAKLSKLAAGGAFGEEGRVANLTLTTPSDTPLAWLLDTKCAPNALAGTCSVSGSGFVTYLPHFEYDITVLHSENGHRRANPGRRLPLRLRGSFANASRAGATVAR